MQHSTRSASPARTAVGLILALCMAASAASCAALPSPGGASPAPPTSPGGGTGGAGGAGSAPGSGGTVPGPPESPIGTSPSDGGLPPGGDAGADLVVPVPGRLDPQDVAIARLAASVDGRRVRVRATFWGGVAPCFALDSATATRAGATITIALRAGADQAGVACPALAKLYATIVDAGELPDGTYTIRPALGEAAPITVAVPAT